MSEKKVEKYLKEQVKAQGGFTRKWVSPGHVGVEDQICFFPNGELWFIEIKDDYKKPTGNQWREIFEQLMLGHNAGYLAGKDEVDAFMKFSRKYWMKSHIMFNVDVCQLKDVHVEFLKQMGGDNVSEHYIVWNESKTEGFITTDKQLAYEVRKSASSNCFDENGICSEVAKRFCDEWYEDNCTIEIITGQSNVAK